MLDVDVVRDLELELPWKSQHPGQLLLALLEAGEGCSPNGPVTVTFLLYVFRYDVMSFLTNRSPIASSTPGGIESGVLPSLEGRVVVAEKFRLAGV